MKNKKNIWQTNSDNDKKAKSKGALSLPEKKIEKKRKEKLNNNEIKQKTIYKSPFKKTKERKIHNLIILAIVVVFISLIILPILILSGMSLKSVNNTDDVDDSIGYIKNKTIFGIEHIASEKYIQIPQYENQTLFLSKKINLSNKFVTNGDNEKSTDYSGTFWIQSTKAFSNSSYMIIENLDNKPVWTSTNKERGVFLEKNPNNNEEFSISFKKNGLYLKKDENSNSLKLSYIPDYFKFIAKPEPIKSTSDYIEKYSESHGGEKITLGAEGNPFAIQSDNSGLWLNSYKDVDLNKIPFNTIDDKEYDNSLTLSNNKETNFFMPKSTLKNPKQQTIEIGAYQTLPAPFELKNEKFKKMFYPLIESSASKDVKLEQYPYSNLLNSLLYEVNYNYKNNNSSNVKTTESESLISKLKQQRSLCQVWLIPKPSNFKKMAIYFPKVQSYLDTRNGNLKLTKMLKTDIGDTEELMGIDYFNIIHSKKRNPESFMFLPTSETHWGNKLKTQFDIQTNVGYENVEGYDFRSYGFNPSDFNKKIFNYSDFNKLTKSEVHKKIKANKKSKQSFFVDGLDSGLDYIATLTMWRNDSVGKHKSTILTVPFNEWGIIYPQENPEAIDPGDPIDNNGKGDASHITNLHDSTAQNLNKNNDKNNQLLSLETAATQVDVSFDFQQGTIDGFSDAIRFKFEAVNNKGDLINGPNDPGVWSDFIKNPSTMTNKTITIKSLTPRTRYKVTTYFYDKDDMNELFPQIQPPENPIQINIGNDTQMYVNTEREVGSVSVNCLKIIKNTYIISDNMRLSDAGFFWPESDELLYSMTSIRGDNPGREEWDGNPNFEFKKMSNFMHDLSKNILDSRSHFGNVKNAYKIRIQLALSGYDEKEWSNSPIWSKSNDKVPKGSYIVDLLLGYNDETEML